MDANLKEVVEFHRNVVKSHAHAPDRTPRESAVIVLMGDLLEALVPSKPTKSKKAKKPK